MKNLQKYATTHSRVNSKGEIFFNDAGHHLIFKEFPGQLTTIFAGNGQPGLKDGPGKEAQFRFPTAIDVDAADNLYIADTGNHAIRKITPDGIVTTLYAER